MTSSPDKISPAGVSQQFFQDWASWQIRVAQVAASTVGVAQTCSATGSGLPAVDVDGLRTTLSSVKEYLAWRAETEERPDEECPALPDLSRVNKAFSEVEILETHMLSSSAAQHVCCVRPQFDQLRLLMKDLPDVASFASRLMHNNEALEAKASRLQQSVDQLEDQVVQLQVRNKKLQEDVDDFEREFSDLKNQDRQVRRLQEELAAQEKHHAAELKTKRTELEERWKKQLTQAEAQHRIVMENMQNELRSVRADYAEASRATAEVTHTLERHQASVVSTITGKDAQIRCMAAECAELTECITQLELQNELLRERVGQLGPKELESSMKTLNDVVDSLTEDLRRTKLSHEQERQSWARTVADLEATIAYQKGKIDQLGSLESLSVPVEDAPRPCQSSSKQDCPRPDGLSATNGSETPVEAMPATLKGPSLSTCKVLQFHLAVSSYPRSGTALHGRDNKPRDADVSSDTRLAETEDGYHSPGSGHAVALLTSPKSVKPAEHFSGTASLLAITTAQKQHYREQLLATEQCRDEWMGRYNNERVQNTRLEETVVLLQERIHQLQENQSLHKRTLMLDSEKIGPDRCPDEKFDDGCSTIPIARNTEISDVPITESHYPRGRHNSDEWCSSDYMPSRRPLKGLTGWLFRHDTKGRLKRFCRRFEYYVASQGAKDGPRGATRILERGVVHFFYSSVLATRTTRLLFFLYVFMLHLLFFVVCHRRSPCVHSSL